jgi:glycosyltransferase involved in cell wall biosynthesis
LKIQPLISCIMPTSDRRAFMPQAIGYFLAQDYPNRELVIVDDGAQCVADWVPGDERIRYLRLENKMALGAKRNLACREAQGDIIAHWDDDDWMADWRLSYQVQSLIDAQADVCGLSKLLFYNPASDQAWQYVRHSVTANRSGAPILFRTSTSAKTPVLSGIVHQKRCSR